jgi:hypothetical protein
VTEQSITVSSANRPVRPVVLVPDVSGLEWQVDFLGALQAPCLIWGGQGTFLCRFVTAALTTR